MTLTEVMALPVEGSARDVLIAVFCHAASGPAAIAMSALVGATGLAERTIHAAGKALEGAGYITIQPGGGRGKGSIYTMKCCTSEKTETPQNGLNPVAEFGENHTYQNNGLQEQTPQRPSNSVQTTEDCGVSDISKAKKTLDLRTRTIARRKQVKDGYLSFIAMLEPDQFVTVPGLAKELGIPPNTVRNDLDAIFRTLDISVSDQQRLKKVQRRPWHKGKLGGTFRPFYERG